MKRKFIIFKNGNSIKKITKKLIAQIEQKHAQYCRKEVLFFANTYAQKNQPLPNERVENYLQPIISYYSSMKNLVTIEFKSRVRQLQGKINYVEIEKKIDTLSTAKNLLLQKINHLFIDRNRIAPETDFGMYKRQEMKVLLLSISECIFNISLFTQIGDMLLLTILLGILFACGQMMAIQFIVLKIREVVSLKWRKIYTALSVLGMLFLDFLLGYFRVWLINKNTPNSLPNNDSSIYLFVVMNLVFQIAVIFLILLFYPSLKDQKILEEQKAIDREISKKQNESNELEEKIIALVNEKNNIMSECSEIVHDEKELIKLIDEKCYEACGLIVHEINIKRSDGLIIKLPSKLSFNSDSNNTHDDFLNKLSN